MQSIPLVYLNQIYGDKKGQSSTLKVHNFRGLITSGCLLAARHLPSFPINLHTRPFESFAATKFSPRRLSSKDFEDQEK
jgi:hypothetical protein